MLSYLTCFGVVSPLTTSPPLNAVTYDQTDDTRHCQHHRGRNYIGNVRRLATVYHRPHVVFKIFSNSHLANIKMRLLVRVI